MEGIEAGLKREIKHLKYELGMQQAEVAELKESIDMLKYVQNEKRIGADAIREMVYAKIESGEWHSLDIAAEQCLEHADKLEGE